jgi:hypothetical protein
MDSGELNCLEKLFIKGKGKGKGDEFAVAEDIFEHLNEQGKLNEQGIKQLKDSEVFKDNFIWWYYSYWDKIVTIVPVVGLTNIRTPDGKEVDDKTGLAVGVTQDEFDEKNAESSRLAAESKYAWLGKLCGQENRDRTWCMNMWYGSSVRRMYHAGHCCPCC